MRVSAAIVCQPFKSIIDLIRPEHVPVFSMLHLHLEDVFITVQPAVGAVILYLDQSDTVGRGTPPNANGEVWEEAVAGR